MAHDVPHASDTPMDVSEFGERWQRLTASVALLAAELTEALRPILEPTIASKLQ